MHISISVELHLDHSIAVAGCMVKGVVLLTLATTAPTPTVHSIDPCVRTVEIVLEGQERTVSGCPDDDYAGEVSSGGNEINLVTVPLIRLVHSINLPRHLATKKDESFTTTTYALPFEMKLPKHLPSSLFCSVLEENNGTFCEVTYHVTALCHLHPQGTTESSPLPSNKQVLWIVAHTPPPPSPLFSDGATEDFPITACCVNQGFIKLGISLQDCSAVIFPHSILCVNVLGKNYSSVPVHHLTARLCEVVEWKVGPDGKQQQRKARTLNETTIMVNNSWAQQWQALPNRGTPCRPKDGALVGDPATSWTSVHNRQGKSLELRWTIPSDIRDSYKGHAIYVRHFVLVKAVMSCPWGANCPEAAHPIHVQRPPIEWSEDGSEHVGNGVSFSNGDAAPQNVTPERTPGGD